jgi:hypothetical protein
LTPEACILIIERFLATNPHQRGIQVADILDMLVQTDSHLQLVEPYWEAQGSQLVEALGGRERLVSASARAAALLFEPEVPTAEAYASLVSRIAWAASENQHGTIGIPQ